MSDDIKFDRALLALSEVYISIHEFNLKTNNLKMIKSNPFIENWAALCEGAQEKMHNVMRNIAVAEHLEEILEFTDLSTLDQRLEDRKDISTVFRGKINGWCRARFVVVDYAKEGGLLHVLFTVECIQEEKMRENHLLYLAQTDLMTGLLNRGQGEKAISDLLKENVYGLFVLFDVDKFKVVNDKYGHQLGDQVLISVADALRAIAREGDVIMRLGGDEFAAYFVGIQKQDEAEVMIQKFFAEVEKISIKPMIENVAVSLGAKIYQGEEDFDDIYRDADRGVYISKNAKGSSFDIV